MNAVTPYLLIGSLRETHDARLLAYYGVGATVLLAERVEHEGIPSLFLPIEDGVPLASGILDEAIAFVREQKAAGRATLVACALGISRSATIAIAAVKEIEGCGLEDALRTVRRQHPDARPHPVLWKSLCARYGEQVSYATVIRKLTE